MYTTKQDFIQACLLDNKVKGGGGDASEAYIAHLGEVYDEFNPEELEAWMGNIMEEIANIML